jgi:hypothetical protein
MNQQEQPPIHNTGPLRLTRRGRLARTAAAIALTIGTIWTGAKIVEDITAPEFPDCLPRTEYVIPEGGTLWNTAEETIRDNEPLAGEDPRKVIVAIKKFSGLENSEVKEGQVVIVPTSFECPPTD